MELVILLVLGRFGTGKTLCMLLESYAITRAGEVYANREVMHI